MKLNFYLSVMAFTLIFILVGCTNNYRDGVNEYEAGNYEKALDHFYKISEEDKYYDHSQEMIAAIDSILEEQRLEQARRDSFAKILNEQKQIFRELVAKQDQATKEAVKRYPNNINKQIDYERELAEQYTEELAAKYNITRDSLTSISLKGIRNRWPMPDL